MLSRISLKLSSFLFYFYLFLAVSGLSCGMRDLFVVARRLFVVGCRLLSSCGMQIFSLQLWCTGSRVHGLCSFWYTALVEVHKLSSFGAWAQLPCDMQDLSSLTRDQTSVPCIVRQILYHWITREVPVFIFLIPFCFPFSLRDFHYSVFQFADTFL